MTLMQKELKKCYIGSTDVKKIYKGSTQIRPDLRQPGANTIAYFPFTDDLLDHGPLSLNWTTNNISLETSGNLTYCKFQGNSANGLYITSRNAPLPLTYSLYLYYDGGGIYGPRLLDNTNSNDNWIQPCLDRNTPGITCAGGTRTTITRNARHHIVITQASDGICCVYNNGDLAWTGSGSTNRFTGMIIGYKKSNNSDYFSGRMSRIIIEDKVRTATEISDYFDQTKSLYGIS